MYSDSILLLVDHCDFYKVRLMSALGLFETFNKFLFFLISIQEEEFEDPELDYKLRKTCRKMIKVRASL